MCLHAASQASFHKPKSANLMLRASILRQTISAANPQSSYACWVLGTTASRCRHVTLGATGGLASSRVRKHRTVTGRNACLHTSSPSDPCTATHVTSPTVPRSLQPQLEPRRRYDEWRCFARSPPNDANLERARTLSLPALLCTHAPSASD
jgi:hypothetical protein